LCLIKFFVIGIHKRRCNLNGRITSAALLRDFSRAVGRSLMSARMRTARVVERWNGRQSFPVTWLPAWWP